MTGAFWKSSLFVNSLRRFIADFSGVTLPLRLIQKNYRNKTCEVLDEDWLPVHVDCTRPHSGPSKLRCPQHLSSPSLTLTSP